MRKIVVRHKHVKSWCVPMLLWTIDRVLHAHHPWHFDPTLSLTTSNRPNIKKKRKHIKAKPWGSSLRSSRHHPAVLGAAISLQLKDYHLSSKLWAAFDFSILHAICSGECPGWVAGMIMKLSHGFAGHFAIVSPPCQTMSLQNNKLERESASEGYTLDGCRRS